MPKRKAHQQLQKAEVDFETTGKLALDVNAPEQSRETWKVQFGEGLFNPENVAKDAANYGTSGPYKHGVIEGLMQDKLLRGVREEILREIHYTQKETDIYKIHQSGDLANLDDLDAASLAKLPCLLKLRDALYSSVFRDYLEQVTGCGRLSGSKTDMAINVYTPGSHLLCHDDVIGSRRISYILYLTDPDDPWRTEWGGALRLFPTQEREGRNGKTSHTPLPDTSLSIFPQWNQLSFFAVQPGFSFHDVGEVFENPGASRDAQPMRAAISGWFHIPQVGEPGYNEGEAEALQKESSLTTLQSSDENFDYPRPNSVPYPEYDPRYLQKFDASSGKKARKGPSGYLEDLTDWKTHKEIIGLLRDGKEDPNFDVLTTEEAEFLIKFINPNFLVPDQVKEMDKTFEETGNVMIENFLRSNFADLLHHQISNHFSRDLPESALAIEEGGSWKVARPPHKHRYLVLQEDSNRSSEALTYLSQLFRGSAFRKWLQLVTSCILKSHDTRVRRFRRGEDYQLAKLYKEDEARIELTLGLTPDGKWEAPEEDDPGQTAKGSNGTNGARHASYGQKPLGHRVAIEFEPLSTEPVNELTNHGGYEMFITGDEDEEDEDESTTEMQNGEQPPVGHHSHLDVTGKQNKQTKKKLKVDPAIYQASSGDDGEQDDVRLNVAAGFNRLSIALRDKGIMRFVKYVSKRSGCDRWDLTGEYEVDWSRSAKAHGWDEEGGDDAGESEEEGDDIDEDDGDEMEE